VGHAIGTGNEVERRENEDYLLLKNKVSVVAFSGPRDEDVSKEKRA